MAVSINDQYSTNDETSSSVNWSAKTKTCDEISAAYNLYPCPSFQEAEEGESSDYTTKQLEQDELLEDLFCSDGVVVPNNFVLSSGRWNIIQDAGIEIVDYWAGMLSANSILLMIKVWTCQNQNTPVWTFIPHKGIATAFQKMQTRSWLYQ
nr:hypothetical protein [Tanacetum cinerariifolium]